MNAASQSGFAYVTFIRTTPAELWEALTEAKLINRYWFGMTIESGWKNGLPWKMVGPDGTLIDSGEILEIDPPRRMVIRWQNEWRPELKAEGASRCTIELEPVGSAVRLSLSHEIGRPESRLIAAVSDFWPLILSNLKSLLETGEVTLTSHPGH